MSSGSVKQTSEGRWTVRWRTPDGRQPRRTFHRKAEADRFLRQTLVEQDRSGLGLPKRGETIKGATSEWWRSAERSVKPRTAEKYLWASLVIEEHVGQIQLGDFNYPMAQRFVDDLAAKYQPRTVSSVYAVLVLVLKNAAKHGKVRDIPKPTLPRIANPKLTIPTRLEVERLAKTIPDLRLGTAIILAGYCGLREGEILALHSRDVNLEEGWVLVHQAVNKTTGALESTKTDRARRVYLPARARDAVTFQLANWSSDRVFPVTGSILHKRWDAGRTAAGLPTVRFHDLRHAAASMMIHAGWSVTQVAKQLGHADPAMTLRVYSHLWPDSYDDAIRRFDEYLDHDASA